MNSLKDTMTSLSELFTTKMNEFQQDLHKSSSPATTSTLAADFKTFKSFILLALTSLKQQIELLSRMIDQQDMRTRRKMLLFHGVTEDKGEDTSARVTSIIAENLNLANFSTTNIKSSHRLGRPGNNKPRPIVVRFNETAVRDKVWYAKTKLKGTGVTQSEFLTKTRHEAFLAARERFGISRCWTREGIIFVVTSDGTRHRAECLADIDEIIRSSPEEGTKSPLTSTDSVQKAPECKAAASRSKRVIKK